MQVDFHPSSLTASPKYNGKPKYQTSSIEKQTDENNYTIKTIGLNANNQTTEVKHTTYENGRLSKEWADYDGDNKPDALDVWEYDDREKVLTWKQDHNGDNLYDCVEKSKFDDHGNIIAWGIDTNMDSKADKMCFYNYEYDENGNITSYNADYDGDKMPDYNSSMEYDEDGKLILKTIDNGNNGFNDEQISYKYDNAGGLTDERHELFYEDGSSCTYTVMYDGNGNVIQKR